MRCKLSCSSISHVHQFARISVNTLFVRSSSILINVRSLVRPSFISLIFKARQLKALISLTFIFHFIASLKLNCRKLHYWILNILLCVGTFAVSATEEMSPQSSGCW